MRPTTIQFVEWRNGTETWKYQGRKYSIAAVWNDIRPRQNKIEWHKLVWSSLAIPRHGLIVWMVLLDRLPTLNRLATWGIQVVVFAGFVEVKWKLEICFLIAVFLKQYG